MEEKIKYITISELAEMLSVSTATIFKLQREGGDLPPCVWIGPRLKRFNLAKVQAWLDAREKDCAAAPLALYVGKQGGRPPLQRKQRKKKTKADWVRERTQGLVDQIARDGV